ncbi:MAG: uroporphyrinogen decarboxylase family protein [Anaerolineae bacterium]
MIRRMSLAWMLRQREGRMVIPLMGFPGVQINHTTLKQNNFNWGVQFWTLFELVRRFQPDGIFTFMDLSVEANALGLPVVYPLHESPTVEYPLVKTELDLTGFYHLDVLRDARVHLFVETMRMMAQYLAVLRGGYCIGPFTLTGLMMGASETALATIENPDLLHRALEFSTHVIGRYAAALVNAGADMIAILEPTAVMLSPRSFWEFSGRYLQQLVEHIEAAPILHICGDTSHLIEQMVRTGAQGLSLDALVDLPTVAARVPEEVVLIGNINPTAVMLYETPLGVYQHTRALLDAMAPYRNFVLSTGCDLPPETPLENIAAFMDAGRGRPLGGGEAEKGLAGLVKERPESILAMLEGTWLRQTSG